MYLDFSAIQTTEMITYFLGIILLVTAITRFLNKTNSPPGPIGVPILGYLPWLDPKKTYETLTNLTKTYGPVFSVNFGSVKCVVVADNKIMKDLFSKDELTG